MNRSNILFITTDQQHWSAMGYRNPEVKTPNLDRLVGEGTTFHRAYTVNPTCTPTRASWITGLYPSQHGAYSLGTKLREDVPTIGGYLSQAGYRSSLVGKAHFQPLLGSEQFPSIEAYPVLHDLDFWNSFSGPFYGFDHIELARNHTDESHAGQHYALWMQEKGYENWRDFFLPNIASQTVDGDPLTVSKRKRIEPGQAWSIPEEIHYNSWIAERTIALMDEHADGGSRADQPFFLWASFFDPHPQYMVPEPYASMYDPDQVTVPDYSAGEFDDKPPYFKLARERRPDFTTFAEQDGNAIHGAGSHLEDRETRAKKIATMYGMMTMLDVYIGKIINHLDALGLSEKTLLCFTSDHGDFWGQHGLTKKAIHHYEDLLRVPLVIRQPNSVPQGVVSESLQSTVDLAPSFLSAAGCEIPRGMTGIDVSDEWYGEEKNLRDHVIVENQHQPTKLNIRTFINSRYKLTVHYNQDYGELYDLESDPGEMINLWSSIEHQSLKGELLLSFIHGEMEKAALPMPRISGA